MTGFKFNNYNKTLSDGEIYLRINKMNEADPVKKYVPAYIFDICFVLTDEVIGAIDIRIGYTDDLVWYGGQIGYHIDDEFRGHGYASKACKLLKKVAIDHNMDVIWITCDENNKASQRTLEKIGCTRIALMPLPEYHDLYQRGQRRVWRYRWIV